MSVNQEHINLSRMPKGAGSLLATLLGLWLRDSLTAEAKDMVYESTCAQPTNGRPMRHLTACPTGRKQSYRLSCAWYVSCTVNLVRGWQRAREHLWGIRAGFVSYWTDNGWLSGPGAVKAGALLAAEQHTIFTKTAATLHAGLAG